MLVLHLVLFLGGLVLTLGQLYEKPVYDIDKVEEHFEEFLKKYGKQYATEEEKLKRLEIFKENLNDIIAKNEESINSIFAVNKFTDLTSEEFINKYTGFRKDLMDTDESYCEQHNNIDEVSDVPEEYDWRQMNILGPIKNQHTCSSCWAFAAVANIESQYAKKNNQLISLSEQELQDCDSNPNLGRCSQGGYAESGMRTVIDKGGIESEDMYPYVNKQMECAFDKSKVVVQIQSCKSYSLSDEDDLKKLLYANGPLTIALDGRGLQAHQSGILDPQYCPSTDSNHAVLLVGYGVDKQNNLPYWIIRNSWGEEAGEKGYWRIARGVNCLNMMAHPASTAVL